ncbi:alpha/beta hydrolase [bacterium]|nr:MAG: alpha/beta hydrolase [bacterium]
MSEFIHRYVPPRGESRRTLLLLHGTGGDENDLLPLGAELDPEAGLLSLRGKVSERGAPRFFRRLAEGVFDQEDLRLRTDELGEFLREASVRYGFDPAGLIAVGYSNGANIAASLLFRHPDALAAAALLHAMVPFVPETTPDLAGKRIFLGAGENDPIVAPEETTRLHGLFHRAGAEVQTAWFPYGHSLSGPEVRAAGMWLESIGV